MRKLPPKFVLTLGFVFYFCGTVFGLFWQTFYWKNTSIWKDPVTWLFLIVFGSIGLASGWCRLQYKNGENK